MAAAGAVAAGVVGYGVYNYVSGRKLQALLPEGVASATSGTSATQQVPWWDSGLTVPGSVLSEVGFRFPDLKPEQTILLRVTAV